MNLAFKILLITAFSGIISITTFAILNFEENNVNNVNVKFRYGNYKKCTFCHNDKIKFEFVHAAAEDDCKNCHQSTGKKHPSSKVQGFTLVSQIPDLCNSCHESKTDKKYVHTQTKIKGCTSCHSPHGSKNKSLLINSSSSEVCKSCHDLKIAKNDVIHAPVEFSDCRDCHDSHQSDNPNLLVKSKPQLCFTCHDDLKNANNMKDVHPVFEDDCGNCHFPHNSPNQYLLSENTPNLCYECHDIIQETIKHSKTVHLPVKDAKNCLNCHSPHVSDNNNLLLINKNTLCLSCHNDTILIGMRTIPNMKKHIEESKYIHEPVKDNCTNCHNPHASENNFLLSEAYPSDEYIEAKPGNFALCFECHDSELLTTDKTETGTNFRDGDKNLHYLHIHGKKGRNCNLCHDVHAAKIKFLIKNRTTFGTWVMPLRFKITKSGGSCRTGCHTEKKYDRIKPENFIMQTKDTVGILKNDLIIKDSLNIENNSAVIIQKIDTVAVVSENEIIKDTINIETKPDVIIRKKDSAFVVSENEIKNDNGTIKNSFIDSKFVTKTDSENIDTITVVANQNINTKKDRSEILNTVIFSKETLNKINSVKVYFETAKYNINENYQKEIQKIINFLEEFPNTQIIIKAYTDNVGSYSSNLILAEKRAKAVKEMMIKKGILPQRCKLEIYGESKPRNTNSTEKGRALNRCVEFKLIDK